MMSVKKKIDVLCLAAAGAALALISPPERAVAGTQDLTREEAARVIEAHYASKPTTSCYLVKDEDATLAAGAQEGLWRKSSEMEFLRTQEQYALTPKGRELFKDIRAPHLMRSRGSLVLRTPLPIRVVKVTGIATHPTGQGLKKVEYEWQIALGAESDPVLRRFCSQAPDEDTAVLQLYDDGWRVSSE